MGKIIRVRTKGLHYHSGNADLPLEPIEGQVTVFIRSAGDVVLYADFSDGLSVPLFTGKSLEQTYHFEDLIVGLRIRPCGKVADFAYRVLQAGTQYRDIADPVPHKAVVQLGDLSESMEQRILRSVDAALSARGLSAGKSRGVNYNDDDGEFGPGYQYDEDVDDEINDATVKAVAAKFAPKRVQSAGDDNSDKSARGELGDTKSGGDTGGKDDNNDN